MEITSRPQQPAEAEAGGSAPAHGNLWAEALARNPEHSQNYAARWERIEASGQDIYGEARLVDAMVERGSRILDAGCGQGRLGGWLADRGHEVTGVDLDAHLISVAEAAHPNAEWHVGDLGQLDLRMPWGEQRRFDLILMAGNVMSFIATDERRLVLERIRAHLWDDGRFVCGFGAGRGYGFEEFLADAEAAGLELSVRLGSWDVRPAGEDFLVGVFTVR